MCSIVLHFSCDFPPFSFSFLYNYSVLHSHEADTDVPGLHKSAFSQIDTDIVKARAQLFKPLLA